MQTDFYIFATYGQNFQRIKCLLGIVVV